MSFHGQPFWWLLTAACLAWYATITIYVAVKGVRDIRGMLRRLRGDREDQVRGQEEPGAPGSGGRVE